MKNLLICALVLCAAFGCDKPTGSTQISTTASTGTAGTNPTEEVKKVKEDKTAPPKTTAQSNNPSSTETTTTSDPSEQKGKNPDRLYQLAELEKIKISYSGKPMSVWLMDTGSKRSEGLMFVTDKEMPNDAGMLFVFTDSADRSFWMHNTKIPLDIAYIAADGKVVSVKHMKAMDDSPVPSEGKAMYALEMKLNAMAPKGIVKGGKFVIPSSIKSLDDSTKDGE